MRPEQVAPYSEEAERGVLGAVVLDAARVLPLLRGKMGFAAEDFYVPAHRVIWETIAEMDARGIVDILTITERLSSLGRLEMAGGVTALDKLVEATPTAANAEYYAELVREKTNLRRIIEAGREAVQRCMAGEMSAAEIVSRGMAELQGVADGVLEEGRSNAQVLDELLVNWTRAHDVRTLGQEHLPGLRTPYDRYNEIMGGLQPGLHFFGGKSSAGKTSLVLNICRKFLLDGHAGLMIQLDDTHEDVVGRLVAMMVSKSLPALSQGFSKHEELEQIKTEIRPLISGMPLWVVEECADVAAARALARYHKARHGIEWLVIDYVQVLEAEAGARDDERIRLGKIAAACKRMWKELRIPVIVVSQTSKFKDSEDDGMRADMSDLFGASELFHAATSVMVMKAVREKVAPEGGGAKVLAPIEWPIDAQGFTKRVAVAGHIVKNKHGPKDCRVHFWALLKYFKFTETGMVGEKTNRRQMTWQEEMQQGGGGVERGGDRAGGRGVGDAGVLRGTDTDFTQRRMSWDEIAELRAEGCS
jgi:replicative DNA helicase